MRKTIYTLGLILSTTLVLISCKKEYDCKCTVYFENGANLQSTDVVKGEVADASEDCDNLGNHYAGTQIEAVKSYECGLHSK